MSANASQLYDEVCQYARHTAALSSIDATLGWDERTQMPRAGAEHRAEQLRLLAGLIHQRWVDPKFGQQLGELAEQLGVTGQGTGQGDSPIFADHGFAAVPAKIGTVPDKPQSNAGVVVRRLRRQHDKRLKLPQSLVEELAQMAVLGQQAWQEAREKDDFPSFRPILEKTIELKRQQAEALGYPQCPYDALLDDYEPEELTANVRRVLAGLRDELVPLVAEIQHSGIQADITVLHRSFPVEAQDRFGREAAAAIGFDFVRGRLDVTAHPFCTTLGPHDCRITTRYDAQFFNSAFFGILHEAGHGLYEQGLPPEQFGLPLGEAISLGIHESQSRLWENFVGRSRPFWRHFFPLAQQTFPALADVGFDDFYFAINDVRPSLVRVEADEATYNLHILIRFELEQALLDGELKPADLPAAWNAKYRQYLGVTPPDDRYGVLQDVHWSAGLIGYFPTYALGNLYAAQLFAQANAELGELDGAFAEGDFRPLLNWLRTKVHCHGQRYTAAELVVKATGNPLSAKPLIAHLRSKLAPLYDIR